MSESSETIKSSRLSLPNIGDAPFSNRELKLMFDDVHNKLDLLLAQTTYTNGKVKRITLWLTIVGTVTLTLLMTNGSELLDFVLKII